MPNCDFKLLWNFIEVALWYECSPVNFLYIFRTHFTKNISGWLSISLLCLLRSKID